MKIGSNEVVFFFFFRKEILINTIWRWGGREKGKESERIPWRAREDISIRICGCSTIILKRAYNLRIMELDYPVSFLPSFTLRFLSIRYSLSVSPLRPPPPCLLKIRIPDSIIENYVDYGRPNNRAQSWPGKGKGFSIVSFRRDREIKKSTKMDLRCGWDTVETKSIRLFPPPRYFYVPWQCPCDRGFIRYRGISAR